jgi:hypothetical protein
MDYNISKGPKPFDTTQILRMDKGTSLHASWQEHLKEAWKGDYTMAEAEVEVRLKSGRKISGHIDGYIPSLNAVYELKTVADSTFVMVRNQDSPIPAHYEQGNLYAKAINADQILFHYYNTNSGESLYLLSPFSQAQADQTMDKFEEREEHMAKGTISDRPYHDPTGSPCWYCPYKEECYSGWAGEVNGMGAQEIDHKPLALAARMALVNKEERLKYDKLEKAEKASIAKLMLQELELNKAITKNHTVTIKLGTKGNPLVTVKENKQ